MRSVPGLVALLLATTGCSWHPRIAEVETVPVRGTVTLDSRPITWGSSLIHLYGPALQSHDPPLQGVGSINWRGRWDATVQLGVYENTFDCLAMKGGVPPGRYAVTVSVKEPWDSDRHDPDNQPKSYIPRHYGERNSTPIWIEVVPDPANGAYDLHLTGKGELPPPS